jgi:hypothetical protein
LVPLVEASDGRLAAEVAAQAISEIVEPVRETIAAVALIATT